MKKISVLGLALMGLWGARFADASIIVPMKLTTGQNIGVVQVDDTIYGLVLTPKLRSLSPGVHGFHVHEMPLCRDHAMSAGGHFDPDNTKQHRGPYDNGHKGDLAVLVVNSDGHATLPVLAPRLKLADVYGRSLMIHAGGDNYADTPEKLGGGGARVACGVIPYH